MAWGQKYQLGFQDLKGIYWVAKFFKDGWTGDVITLRGAGTPAVYELLNESDHVFDPIKETQVVFSMIIEDTHILRELCSEGDMTTYVELFQDEYSSDADPYWVGYVDASQYEEPYDVFPYEVNITCIDGLGLLRKMLYETYQESFDYDRASEAAIILDVLADIGYTEFKEYVNLYEEEMDDAISDSPTDQILLDQDVFIERYDIDVLQQILLKYNACIRQKDGVFCIYRPKELIDTTVWGRHFTAADTKTSVSYTPTQYINRTGLHTSSLRQVPGGRIISQFPARTIRLTQDYGYKDSWIDNWQFKGVTFNESTNMFDGWTYSSGGILPVLYTLKGEGDGIVLTATTGGPGASPILYQSFGFYAKVTSELFVIEFEYFAASLVDGQTVSICVRIKSDNAAQYLYPFDDNEAKWKGTTDYLDPTETLTAGQIGEWKTYKRYFTGVPTAGSYTIGLYQGTSSVSNAFWGIKNIKFYVTSDSMSIKRTPKPTWFEYFIFGKQRSKEREQRKHPPSFDYFDVEEIATRQYTATNSSVEAGEFEQEHILGDITDANLENIIDQFRGSMLVPHYLYRVDTVTLTGTSGTANITCNGITKLATFTFDLEGTAEQFVADWGDSGGDFYLSGVQVSWSGDTIIFTGLVKGFNFSGDTTIANVTPNLSGSVVETTPSKNPETPTVTWWKRMDETSYDLESSGNLKELLELMKEEIAEQYSRTKQLLSIPIQETTQDEITTLNVIGNIQDDYNVDDTGFDVRDVDGWTKSQCLLTFQDGQAQIDKILLSGTNGACEYGTELGVKEVTFITDLETTAAKFVTDYAADLLSVNGIVAGYEVVGSSVYLVFIAAVPGVGFTTIVNRTSGSLDGTIINFIANATTSTKNYATYTATGTDSCIVKSGLNLRGSVHRYLNIRYKIVSGNWTSGQIFYSTVAHGRDGGFRVDLSLINDGQWHIEVLDMADLTSGGTDWIESFITGIWFDFTDQTPVVILLDWIGFDKVFVINRGSFDIRNRRWELDLMEVIR